MDNQELKENTKIEYIIIYKTYTPKSKANMYKYREEHIEKCRAYQRKYYKDKYDNDPIFKEMQKGKSKITSRKNREKKNLEKKNDLEFLTSFFLNN